MLYPMYGYGDEPPEEEDRGAVCPECGRACYKIYRRGAEILGCDECIDEVDADDVDACFDYLRRAQ